MLSKNLINGILLGYFAKLFIFAWSTHSIPRIIRLTEKLEIVENNAYIDIELGRGRTRFNTINGQ